MKRTAIVAAFFAVLFFSFKTDRGRQLCRSWRATRMESPQLDSFYRLSKRSIDTIGQSTDKEVNRELYGVTNMDSFRHALSFLVDSAMQAQMNTVKSTVFTFRKDGVAILSVDSADDSCKWHFDPTGKLVLTPLDDTELVSNLRVAIVALSDTSMRMKFIEDNACSIVTFRPEIK